MIDVVIQIYGKPWQTLCTLKSLMLHSGKHIDNIYFITEKEQPYNDSIEFIKQYFNNLICFTPQEFHHYTFKFTGDYSNESSRYSIRYQYGIEKSDKRHVFITHNDILYTGDIVGDMLSKIGDAVGIGLIGMCWNCSMNKAGICNTLLFDGFKLTYNKVLDVLEKYPTIRKYTIDKENPMPLPECRLNEFPCLINREISVNECKPKGDTLPFGYFGIDIGCQWFRSLFLKGYKFKTYDIGIFSTHGYYAQYPAGYPITLNERLYYKSEAMAKEYYEKNFQ